MLKSSEAWKLEQQKSLQAGFLCSFDSSSLFKHLLLPGSSYFFSIPALESAICPRILVPVNEE